MGWTYPSYQDIQATGDPSVYRTAMFEIIRGINERNDALGSGSGSLFKKADGTLSQYITMADLDGMFLPGAFSYLKYNMQMIHFAIRSMASEYTTTSGRSASYDATSICAAVGLPSVPPSGGDKWTDYRWWQGWQDALGLLIYGWSRNPDATETGLRKIGSQSSNRNTSWQNATGSSEFAGGQMWWPSIVGSENRGFNVIWIMEVPFQFKTSLQRVAECSVTGLPDGVLSEVWIDNGPDVEAEFSYHGYVDDPLEIDFASATDSFTFTSTISSGDEAYSRQLVNSDFPLGATADFTMTLNNTPPVLSPITSGIAATGAGWAAFFGQITYYIDLASVLTDQA